MYEYDSSLVGDLYADAYGRMPSVVFWILWNKGTDSDREIMWHKILEDLSVETKETEEV